MRPEVGSPGMLPSGQSGRSSRQSTAQILIPAMNDLDFFALELDPSHPCWDKRLDRSLGSISQSHKKKHMHVQDLCKECVRVAENTTPTARLGEASRQGPKSWSRSDHPLKSFACLMQSPQMMTCRHNNRLDAFHLHQWLLVVICCCFQETPQPPSQ